MKLICIMVNFYFRSQGLISGCYISPPPIPLISNLSFTIQTENLLHAGRIDSSDGRVLALHAKGPGFESRCGRQ